MLSERVSRRHVDKMSLCLVADFLKRQKMPKSLAPELLDKVASSDLLSSIRDYISSHKPDMTEKAVYVSAYALEFLLYSMRQKAESGRRLTLRDARFVVTRQLHQEAAEQWGVFQAEQMAESEGCFN